MTRKNIDTTLALFGVILGLLSLFHAEFNFEQTRAMLNLLINRD